MRLDWMREGGRKQRQRETCAELPDSRTLLHRSPGRWHRCSITQRKQRLSRLFSTATVNCHIAECRALESALHSVATPHFASPFAAHMLMTGILQCPNHALLLHLDPHTLIRPKLPIPAPNRIKLDQRPKQLSTGSSISTRTTSREKGKNRSQPPPRLPSLHPPAPSRPPGTLSRQPQGAAPCPRVGGRPLLLRVRTTGWREGLRKG